MLQNTKDTKTYFLTEFFGTEKVWTTTLSESSEYTLSLQSLSARSWTVTNTKTGGQSKEKPNSVLLNSWDEGKNTFTFKNADTKLVVAVKIPFLAKWALVTYITDTTTSYEVQTFN